MRKLALLVVVVIAALMSAWAGEVKPMKAKVSDLDWFAGRWVCDIWGGQFEEHWTKSTGDSMLAVGRLVVNGKTQFI